MAACVVGGCGVPVGLARRFQAARTLLRASASVACRKWSGACELGRGRGSGPSSERRAWKSGATAALVTGAGWGRCRPRSSDLRRPLPQGCLIKLLTKCQWPFKFAFNLFLICFFHRFLSPEFIPPRGRTNPLKFQIERKDMLERRKVLNIPEFYVGSILRVTTADPYASGKISQFLGICIQRAGKGLGATFILRNIIEGQ
ncbi:PREDICTED: 39S ribosomal protein L19, mitochondrial-like, partial [Galeopterus variegatus]|uniref:Large ribosomal subunit protein bL19m n=1 Tax=Galeopterus variegatus TaxID=482537 RepID=A0ABM0Q4K6_GALVR